MRVIVAVGTRANVVKVAPLLPALSAAGFDVQVAFSGGRDIALDSGTGYVTVDGVSIPAPTWYVDSAAVAVGTAAGAAMHAYEQLFAAERPDAVLVCGDVDGTLAAAVSAAKAGLPVVHLEAGVRCGDLSLPDELNRVLISRVAAMHLTPSAAALENLEDEGIEPERIHFVGNAVAEQALRELDDAAGNTIVDSMGLRAKEYVLAVLHRPDSLGNPVWLSAVAEALGASAHAVVIADADDFMLACERERVDVSPAIGVLPELTHLQMLTLICDAAVVVTDSGGIQEEACVLCTPCITVRGCTEHTETTAVGANVLVPADAAALDAAIRAAAERRTSWAQPARWDRAVSDRVVRALRRGIMPLR